MPFSTCQVCGTPIRSGTRCYRHPLRKTASQARGYRGLASYRRFRARIIERDAGVCAICHRPGATELGHRTPYADLDPQTRDDPDQWRDEDFAAVHDTCNKRLGANPIP